MKRAFSKHAHATLFSRLGRSARDMARSDQGLIFTTIIATLGYGAIALGLVGTGVAVANKVTINESTEQMRQQAQTMQQRLEGNDSPQAQVLKDNAQIMQQAADKMDSDANWDLGVAVTSNALDAATFGISSKSKAGYQAVKFVWDGYTGWQIGQSAFDAVDPPAPEAGEAIQMLQNAPRYQPGDDSGTMPNFSSDVDSYIFQTQTNVMSGEVSALYPDADPALVQDLSQQLVIDYTLDQMSNPDSEVQLVGDNPFLEVGVADMTAQIDPNQAVDVSMGQISVDSADQTALSNGEKEFVVGVYYGADGLEPVIVTGDPTSGLQTEFTLLPDQPVVDTGSDFKPVIEDMPDWWDGTVDSCPYLYVFDGEGFSPVNDIVSVSRDPNREYDDFMLFSALPSADGDYDVQIVEVRDEETWLDRVAFFAVDVPEGFGAVVSPDGDVFSTGLVRAPDRAWGATPGVLGRVDGRAVRLCDGPGPEALFTGVGDDAVLLLSMDGFEDDGDPGALLFQRPTVFLEAWDGEAWVAVGGVHPREELDTMALDVSAFVVDGEVRVRLSIDSCHVDKYQLLDRLALSTADRSLARVTPIAINAATFAGVDVSGVLKSTDDVRVHTVPGDVIEIAFAATESEYFVVESRGWYLPLD